MMLIHATTLSSQQRCTGYGDQLAASEFMLHRRSSSGLVHLCKGCYASAEKPGWWDDAQEVERLRVGTKVWFIAGAYFVDTNYFMTYIIIMLVKCFLSTSHRVQVCKECNQLKTLDCYALDHRYGHMGRCRTCVNTATRQRHQAARASGTDLCLVRFPPWIVVDINITFINRVLSVHTPRSCPSPLPAAQRRTNTPASIRRSSATRGGGASAPLEHPRPPSTRRWRLRSPARLPTAALGAAPIGGGRSSVFSRTLLQEPAKLTSTAGGAAADPEGPAAPERSRGPKVTRTHIVDTRMFQTRINTQERRRQYLDRAYRVADDGSINYKDVYRVGKKWYAYYRKDGVRLRVNNLWIQLEALLLGQMREGIRPLRIVMGEYILELPSHVLVNDGSSVSIPCVLDYLQTDRIGQSHVDLYRRQRATVPPRSRVGKNLSELCHEIQE